MGLLKEAWQATKRKVITSSVAASAFVLSALGASAAAPNIDTTAVTSTFSSITTTILVVIGAVAASAVIIMGTFLAWRYGRKLFGMLAK